MSKSQHLTTGVPQGSVLRPLLFCLQGIISVNLSRKTMTEDIHQLTFFSVAKTRRWRAKINIQYDGKNYDEIYAASSLTRRD